MPAIWEVEPWRQPMPMPRIFWTKKHPFGSGIQHRKAASGDR